LVFPNQRGSYESHDNMVKRHFMRRDNQDESVASIRMRAAGVL